MVGNNVVLQNSSELKLGRTKRTAKETDAGSVWRRSSMKERKEDALAPVADEGRDKLRKAAGRRK